METLGGLDELKYKPAASLGCMIARPDPTILALELQTLEFIVRQIGDKSYDIRIVETACVIKAFPYPIPRAWPSDNKIHLRKICDLAIIQVDCELKC